jgi:hypothetical protein
LRPQWTQIRSRIPVTVVISQWCRPILQLMFFFVFMPSECEAHGWLSVRWTTDAWSSVRGCSELRTVDLSESCRTRSVQSLSTLQAAAAQDRPV